LLRYTLLPPLSSLNLLVGVVSTRFVDPSTTWAKEVLKSTFLGDRKDHLGRFDCRGCDEEEDKSLDTVRSRLRKN